MWVLDANMDVHLIALLGELGISCEAATRRGWGGLNNGELLAAAVEDGFTCLLTRDRLLADSAGKVLEANPGFSIVVIHLPQRPWREYIRQFRSAWEKQPIFPIPGAITHWPLRYKRA